MPGPIENVTLFLIETLFELYILALVLRVLFAWARVDYYNPVSQFLVTITRPVLQPLRSLIPSLGRLDTAAVVLAIVLQYLQLWLVTALQGFGAGALALVLVAIVQLLKLVVYVYIFAIIIQAVLSWLSPGMHGYSNPAASVLYDLNEPILRPIRQVVPMVGMVDLSPLVAIILLNMVLVLLSSLL